MRTLLAFLQSLADWPEIRRGVRRNKRPQTGGYLVNSIAMATLICISGCTGNQPTDFHAGEIVIVKMTGAKGMVLYADRYGFHDTLEKDTIRLSNNSEVTFYAFELVSLNGATVTKSAEK